MPFFLGRSSLLISPMKRCLWFSNVRTRTSCAVTIILTLPEPACVCIRCYKIVFKAFMSWPSYISWLNSQNKNIYTFSFMVQCWLNDNEYTMMYVLCVLQLLLKPRPTNKILSISCKPVFLVEVVYWTSFQINFENFFFVILKIHDFSKLSLLTGFCVIYIVSFKIIIWF